MRRLGLLHPHAEESKRMNHGKSSVDLFTISWSRSAFCHRLDLLIIAKVDADVKSSSLLPSTSSTALLVVFAL
jgi:hypothetical protein